MNKTITAVTIATLGLLASACSSDTTTTETEADIINDAIADEEGGAESAGPEEDLTASNAAGTNGFITTSETDFGTILVDANGFTLYGFTSDTNGTPTCEGDCETIWPAVTIDSNELPEGLDPALFSLVDAVDGTKQLKAGDWPLYYFADDVAAGDTNGQSVSDVWFVVSSTGELVS